MKEGDNLPPGDLVFVRIPKNNAKANIFLSEIEIQPAAFKNTPKDGNNLSCDWSHYVTALDSWNNIAKIQDKKNGKYKKPKNWFMVSFVVQELLDIPYVTSVNYIPLKENIAHSEIYKDASNPMDTVFRQKMASLAKLEIVTSEDAAKEARKIELETKLNSLKSQTKITSKSARKISAIEEELNNLNQLIE